MHSQLRKHCLLWKGDYGTGNEISKKQQQQNKTKTTTNKDKTKMKRVHEFKLIVTNSCVKKTRNILKHRKNDERYFVRIMYNKSGLNAEIPAAA